LNASNASLHLHHAGGDRCAGAARRPPRLGFHAVYRFFDRRDQFAHLVASENPCVRDDMQLLDEMFPLASKPDPYWPRQHGVFADHLL
jgi:hypothetical protein